MKVRKGLAALLAVGLALVVLDAAQGQGDKKNPAADPKPGAQTRMLDEGGPRRGG